MKKRLDPIDHMWLKSPKSKFSFRYMWPRLLYLAKLALTGEAQMFTVKNSSPGSRAYRDAMGPGYFSALSSDRVSTLFAASPAPGRPVQRRN